jgi:hypothetical protein
MSLNETWLTDRPRWFLKSLILLAKLWLTIPFSAEHLKEGHVSRRLPWILCATLITDMWVNFDFKGYTGCPIKF